MADPRSRNSARANESAREKEKDIVLLDVAPTHEKRDAPATS